MSKNVKKKVPTAGCPFFSSDFSDHQNTAVLHTKDGTEGLKQFILLIDRHHHFSGLMAISTLRILSQLPPRSLQFVPSGFIMFCYTGGRSLGLTSYTHTRN